MRQHIPQLVVAPKEGTCLAWVNGSVREQNPEKLEQFLRSKAYLFVNNDAMFGTGGKGFIRRALACPEQVLKAGLERLQQAVEQASIYS